MSLPLLIQFVLCPLVFLALLRISAPYGRHGRAGWGPVLPGRAAWLLMELPALLVIGVLVLTSPAATAPGAWVPLLFWLGHYAYRTFIFPAMMRPSGSPFPAAVVLFAVAFNVLNGYNNAHALIDAGARPSPLLSLHFVAGTMIFLVGFLLHVRSDLTIRNLRRRDSSVYGIPQGGLFRWVSSPNYLGEIIQWFGWALMTWSLAGLAFALFTFCNLVPRAIANHRWYREYFSEYPPARKVLVPGLF